MNDIGVIITVIACFVSLLGTMICLFIYLANKIDSIKNETQDFHGRLCKLEEKYILMMQRIWEGK